MKLLNVCLLALSVMASQGKTAGATNALNGLPPQVDAGQTELPMRLVDGMPAVEVFVNQQGPFTFRIDTGGAGQARVDAAIVERLKLPQVGEARGSAGTGGAAVAMPIIRLDSLKLGPLEFKNVEAPSRNYNDRGGERIDGILCFNLFADYLLTLDYPAHKVVLRRGELPAPDGKQILPFETPSRIPVIKIDLNGTPAEAHLDSGNMAAGFMLSQLQAEKLKFSGDSRVIGRGRSVSGDFEIKEAPLAGEIRIGSYRFPSPVIRYAAVFRDANVGAAVLREFAITFDQKNQRVKWERNGEVITLAPPTPPRSASTAAPLSADEARKYAGIYGQRTITADGGQLYLQRTGGPKLKLIRLGAEEFGLEEVPAARIKFGKDSGGKISELKVLNPAGEWESAPRSN